MLKFFAAAALFLSLRIFAFTVLSADLTVVQTTDVHGASGVCDYRPGIARIAAGIESIRADAEGDILLIDCGDTTQGTFFSSLDKGKAMIDALNELKYDVWVPGNHDFDYGTDSLLERMRQFHGTVLCANIEFLEAPGVCRPWGLFRKNGWKIAVIGMSPPYLRSWIAPAQLRGIREKTMEDTLNDIMPSIEKENPDLVILAIHLGEFTSGRLNEDGKRHSLSRLTSRHPRIRLVLGGHTHQTVPMKKLYPETWFVQAPALGDGLAEIRVGKGKSAGDLSFSSKIIPVQEFSESETMLTALASARAGALNQSQQSVASVPFLLAPMTGPGKRCRLAEILCAAMREGTGADAAFSTTLSSYRTDKTGTLLEYQVFLLAPYENFISIVNLTPSQAREILEEQLVLPWKSAFMVADGIEYDAGPDGKIRGALRRNGKPWTDEKDRMRTAFGSFAVSGAGGRYPVLKKIAEADADRKELKLTVRDVLRDYLKRHFPVR